MEKLKIKISLREYVKLLSGLTYRKPVMIVILSIDLLMMTWIILWHLNVQNIPKITFYQYTTVILITIVQPIVILSSIRRNYQSSAHLKEKIEIEFTKEFLKITGESFYTELTWTKTFKVKELKEWFLIYQNNFSAVMIPKKVFDKDGEEKFKNLIKSIPGLKLELLPVKKEV